MAKYICWGDDKEDLTKKVEENVRVKLDLPIANIEVFSVERGNKPRAKMHLIHVVCSKGHDNIFEVKEK